MYYTDEELENIAKNPKLGWQVFHKIMERGLCQRSEDPNTRYIKKYPYDEVIIHNTPEDRKFPKMIMDMEVERKLKILEDWHNAIGKPINIEALKSPVSVAV